MQDQIQSAQWLDIAQAVALVFAVLIFAGALFVLVAMLAPKRPAPPMPTTRPTSSNRKSGRVR